MKITHKIYAESVAKLASGMSEKDVDTLAREFSQYFAKRGKLKLLRSIIGYLEKRADAAKGAAVRVTVAAGEYDAADRVRKHLVLAKEMAAVTAEADPSIIGGLIIQVGDVRLDASISHQLRMMRKHIKS